MSGRLLSFKDYIGGSDNVFVLEMFPRNQKTFTYDFSSDVSGYEFSADYQTIVLDQVTYDRVTGDPNFADTEVIGYFDNKANVSPSLIGNASASTGQVELTIPSERYTGAITPNARSNVAMTVVSFQWITDDSPQQKDMHRLAVIERWEAGVTPGDPTLSNTFIKIGSGAISTFSHNGSTDASRVEGQYLNQEGIVNGASEGSAAAFDVIVDSSGTPSVNIVSRGASYAPGDTITIYDSNLGNGGPADITITISTTA